MNGKIIVATAAGLTGLVAAASAFAWCPMNPGPAMGPGPQGDRQPAPEQRVEGRNQALESVLTLKDSQKEAFKAYAEARTKWAAGHGQKMAEDPAKVFDEQTRLEARAAQLKQRAELLADVAAKRAALWKALDPQQKMVLEAYETHGFGGGHGMRMKEERRGQSCGCPAGDGPRAELRPEPRPHHPDAPQHY